MIYDSLEHIETYKGISEDICTGLEFLSQAKADLACGVHQISPRVRFIDIQFLLKGEEKVCSLPLPKLKETKAYSADADAAFYAGDAPAPQEVLLGDGYFAIYFPQDGHMPQLCAADPVPVKKVVVKIEIA